MFSVLQKIERFGKTHGNNTTDILNIFTKHGETGKHVKKMKY